MPQRYKLRLSDGTFLSVDVDGLRAWTHDGAALAQPLGSQHWRPLKQVLAEEENAERLLRALIPPQPKNATPEAPAPAAAPVEAPRPGDLDLPPLDPPSLRHRRSVVRPAAGLRRAVLRGPSARLPRVQRAGLPRTAGRAAPGAGLPGAGRGDELRLAGHQRRQPSRDPAEAARGGQRLPLGVGGRRGRGGAGAAARAGTAGPDPRSSRGVPEPGADAARVGPRPLLLARGARGGVVSRVGPHRARRATRPTGRLSARS